MKLTKTRVEALAKPETGQAFYWDWEGMPNGFGVRVTSTGARSYILQKRIDGKTKRITLGQHGDITCDQAKIKAAEEMLLFSKGTNSKAVKKRTKTLSITLREVAEVYCKERRTSKGGELTAKTQRDILRHINSNFTDWADKPIACITRDLCSARFSEMSARTEAQANQAFRILRALINFAMENYRPEGAPLMPENPVAVLSGKKIWNPNKARTGRIPLEKVGDVWNLLQERRVSPAALPIAQTGADIVLFLLLTGCRWSEAAQLTWDRVDLIGKAWHLPDPKNHNPVTLPLSPPLCVMLKERPRIEGNDYVFPGRKKDSFVQDARYTMELISKIAGLHLTPHDLRRTFIAIGVKNGLEMWKLKLLTNHISKGDVTIDHYTETSDLRYLSAEAEAIATWIMQQGKIAAADNVVQLLEVAA